MSDLRQGRIVWVEMLDPQGRNPKVRPAVVLTPTDEIQPGGDIAVAAITTQTDSIPAERAVELPWHRDGHPRTKLNRRNVVACDWLARIRVADIRSFGGLVPFADLKVIVDLATKASPQPPPTAPPAPPPPPASP